jgi:hypothetical protein
VAPLHFVLWLVYAVLVTRLLRSLVANWVPPQWRHEVFIAIVSVSVAAIMGSLGTGFYWLVLREPRIPASSKTARMSVFKVEVLEAKIMGELLKVPSPWPVINVHYTNAGDAVAEGVALRSAVAVASGPLTPEKFQEIQDGMLRSPEWDRDLKRKALEQLHPAEGKYVSLPPEDNAFATDFRQNFEGIRDGTVTVIVVLTWKFRDESSGGRLRVTEKCFWMSGGNFAQHDCGRNRTFLE